ncbi:MAG: hypothetical protein AB2794_01085 [Candidatus Thiodiazotropha endolucinida]
MELRKAVWDSMLDADMNSRYWKYLVDRYSKRETVLKIFLAIMASGTVAGWGIWEEYAIVWKGLSSGSALVAIALPILNYQKLIERFSELAGKWGELRIEYEDMWLEVKGQPDNQSLVKTYKKFRATEISLEKKESKMPNDKKLLKACFEEVKKSRGLN